jgi:hypothetical protein
VHSCAIFQFMDERLTTGRLLFRFALAVAFAAALAMPIIAFIVRGPDNPETWTFAAASLAVVTSIIAAWSSLRVVELQEDAQKPNPYPAFDFTSRSSLAMIRVKNIGSMPAHNISLEWVTELKNSRGETIGFPKVGDSPSISALLPGESISQIIDVQSDFFKNLPDDEYTGTITFQDSSKHPYIQPFRLDARPYASSPVYDDEAQQTHQKLQKIPEAIEALRKAIEELPQKLKT